MRMLHSLARNLARPAIVFYTLPALMVLLVAGTLVQGEIGIYEAQKQYFASFILWAGPLPLPGGFALLGFIALNLTLKFILYSEWRWRQAGIILAHLGALTLLIGGLLTALCAREGFMALAEGQASPFVYDYHARELSVFRSDDAVFKVPFAEIKPGKAITIPGLPFTLTALAVCENCNITRRAETEQDFVKGAVRDLAANMALAPRPRDKENERNLAGLTFAVTGAGPAQNGTYIAFEAMPRPVELSVQGHDYRIILGKAQRTLPFTLTLREFRKDDHPGTNTARAYESDIRVQDGVLGWDAGISMNAPFRYRGYTFYQSSFEEGAGDGAISILSVVENKGRLIPYIGTFIIAAGLILHLVIVMRRKAVLGLLLALALYAPALPAQAAGLPVDDFKTLPIQHEGRIKPLESFARLMLARLSGQETLAALSAAEWLAESLFDPAAAAARPVFAVPETLAASWGESGLVSYAALGPRLYQRRADIAQLILTPPEKLSAADRALLDLQKNYTAYGQVLRALTPVLPLALDLPPRFAPALEEGADLSYAALLRLRPRIESAAQDIIRRKGEDLKSYDEDELKTLQLSFALDQIGAGGAGNALFAVIPPAAGSQIWQSPWQIVAGEGDSPLLHHWRLMGLSWQQGDAARWHEAVTALKTDLAARPYPGLRPAALMAEAVYQDFKPYRWAMGMYAGALALLALSAFRPRFGSFESWGPPALRLFGLAIVMHAGAILARVIILERPPVGTLHESVLFVALVAALAGLIAALRLGTKLPAGAGAMAALGLLAIAPVTIPDSSNFDVLGAVLNTSFWLATHVLIITAGYGFCVVTALLAHVWLARRSPALLRLCYTLSVAALLFTCVGTILGGIWADQSWGRFWGWDPKENGALLIVLWLIWLQHGRLSGHVNEAAFAAGLAALNIIVALSWFGVNLLGVGLHSYGFTSGLAAGLFSFCAAELLLIGALWYRSSRC